MATRTLTVAPSQRPGLFARIGQMGTQLRSIIVNGFTLREPWEGLTGTTSSGIYVTLELAFTFSAFYDGVNQISSDTAKLPLNLLKRRQDGGSDHYTESKLYRLLKDEANPDMGSMVFRRTLVAHALTSKGGFAEIERDDAGRPKALWPITPDRVQPFLEKTVLADGRYRSRLRYRIDGTVILEAHDMIHIHGLGYDGYCAYPIIEKARKAVGLALATEQFGSTLFENGTLFGGVMSTEDPIGPEAEAAFRANIEALHKSPDKAHRFLMLTGGWKYQQLGAMTPNDSQMDAIRNKQVEEVARFLNMPLHKLKNLDRATNNNIEQQDLEYYKGPIMNWVTLIEQEFNRKLIAPLEAKQQFIKHNSNAFLRGDIKSRYDALGIARDKGIICADEWRELEDMNPQPDGQGKVFLVQQAMIPADKIGPLVDAQIKKTNTPPPARVAPAPKADDPAAKAAQARAEHAEALAADARATESLARERLVALEATHTATVEELQARRDDLDKMASVTRGLTELSDQLRGRADAFLAERDAALLGKATEVESRQAAERLAASALATAEAAEAIRDTSIASATEAEELARQAQIERDAAVARAVEAERMAAEATTGRAVAEEARDLALKDALDAMARSTEADEARAIAADAAAVATTQADASRAEAERLVAEAIARADLAVEARGQAEETARHANTVAEQARTEVRLAEERAEAATAKFVEEEAKRQAAEVEAQQALAGATSVAQERDIAERAATEARAIADQAEAARLAALETVVVANAQAEEAMARAEAEAGGRVGAERAAAQATEELITARQQLVESAEIAGEQDAEALQAARLAVEELERVKQAADAAVAQRSILEQQAAVLADDLEQARQLLAEATAQSESERARAEQAARAAVLAVEVAAEEARQRAELETRQKIEYEQRMVALADQLSAAEVERDRLRADAEAASQLLDEHVTQLTEARETVTTLESTSEGLRQQIGLIQSSSEIVMSAHGAQVEALKLALATTEQSLADTRGRVVEMETTATTAIEEADKLVAEARTAREVADAARVEAVLAAEATTTRLQTETETERQAATRLAEDAVQRAQEAEQRAIVAAADREAAFAEVTRVRQAEDATCVAVIGAHRGLVSDIMRRMIERETDRAKRAQTTPEKLRHWLETFYGDHENLCATALLPAVRVHLAFVRSPEPALEVSRALAKAHAEESVRQIRTLLDGDAEELAGSLPALLHRWEQERVSTIADSLMEKELEYVRSR